MIGESMEYKLAKAVLRQITGNEEGAERWMKCWLEPHRHYHGFDHFLQMCNDIPNYVRPDIFLTIVFHDIIYDPRRNDNEERSVGYFRSEMSDEFIKQNPQLFHDVCVAIMETKHTSPPESELGKLICKADMNVLLENDIDGLIEYEMKLSREFQTYPHEMYRQGRVQFLSKWVDKNPAIKELIDFVQHRRMNIGIYAGSFDPFTIGHQNILHKAERIFDKVIVARGLNPAKSNWAYRLPPCLEHHQQLFIGTKKNGMPDQKARPIGGGLFEAGCYPHLASAMEDHPNATLIRGLRGSSDLEAETVQQIYVEKMMKMPLNTVYITCDREFDHISSSAFRQLLKVDSIMAADCCPNGMPEA